MTVCVCVLVLAFLISCSIFSIRRAPFFLYFAAVWHLHIKIVSLNLHILDKFKFFACFSVLFHFPSPFPSSFSIFCCCLLILLVLQISLDFVAAIVVVIYCCRHMQRALFTHCTCVHVCE